ncbi:unnamed protein product [Acanthoscelides obtectus]|uniref:Uncharacterized protein n=1 Tax=Acanthoscelides obtectus TaxID=200917 RepID=A0A9P0PNI7_ACAOB|nr:unnamed protein product [Acanthoscelides obtectus]CAK1656816.1 Vasopressin V1a receptor [Acanthoscelides obtectus]
MYRTEQAVGMNFSIKNLSRSMNIEIDAGNQVTDRDESLAKIEIAVLALIFIVMVIGNSTVLLALWIRKSCSDAKFSQTATLTQHNRKKGILKHINKIITYKKIQFISMTTLTARDKCR